VIPARILIAEGEKFLSLTDCKAALRDPAFIQHLLAVMKVGHDKQRPPEEIVACVVCSALYELSGDAFGSQSPTQRN
jgi:hypothetical protein